MTSATPAGIYFFSAGIPVGVLRIARGKARQQKGQQLLHNAEGQWVIAQGQPVRSEGQLVRDEGQWVRGEGQLAKGVGQIAMVPVLINADNNLRNQYMKRKDMIF